MHVIYIIDSLLGGGAERSLAALAPLYATHGIELEVIYLKERAGLQGELEAAGARLFYAGGSGGRAGNIRRIVRILRRRPPDLVHTTLFESDIAGRTAARWVGVPAVSSLVNVQYGPEHFQAPQIKQWRLRAAQLADTITARVATRMHALTEHVAITMAGRLGVPLERIDVIPRGRDPQRLGERSKERSRRTRARLGIDESVPLVVAASRQEFQKGLDVLLESWPSVIQVAPKAVLAIAGREGNQSASLRTRAADLGPNVRFLGARDDVPDLLTAADTFVLPSRWEGLGSVLLEAMALEAPIVASDLAPIREVVSDSATLVPPADPAALAQALVRRLKEPDEGALLAASARSRFLEHFTIEIVADQMRCFYERAIKGSERLSGEPVA